MYSPIDKTHPVTCDSGKMTRSSILRSITKCQSQEGGTYEGSGMKGRRGRRGTRKDNAAGASPAGKNETGTII